MKYCPTCEKRYDEEILRFCMKDGTPLVDEEEPTFVEMPSESIEVDEDDIGDVTIIRKERIPTPAAPPPQSSIDDISFTPDELPPAQRIVVPTEPAPMPRRNPVVPYQQQQQPNTLKVVVLTIFGTLAVLSIGALGFWLLQGSRPDNTNVNTNFNAYLENTNTNVNTNLGLDFNFNTNSALNSNSLSNINTSLPSNTEIRTPTPTPTPRPSPSASPTPERTPDDDVPSPTPVRRTPTPTPTPIVVRTPPPTRSTPDNRLDG